MSVILSLSFMTVFSKFAIKSTNCTGFFRNLKSFKISISLSLILKNSVLFCISKILNFQFCWICIMYATPNKNISLFEVIIVSAVDSCWCFKKQEVMSVSFKISTLESKAEKFTHERTTTTMACKSNNIFT